VTPNVKKALAAAGAGAAVLLLWPSNGRTSQGIREAPPFKPPVSKLPGTTSQGSVVCPGEKSKIPASVATVKPGDFVAIALQSVDGNFFETTWAIVDSINSTKTRLLVRITGTIAKSSLTPTIHTEKHGFAYLDKILLKASCVWDVFPIHPKGLVLCGLHAKDFVKIAPSILTPEGLPTLAVGQTVTLYLAPRDPSGYFPGPGSNVLDPVEVRITKFSQTGSIIEGIVLSTPINTAVHGYAKGSTVYFTRDCVYA
jgi:hypothetical protein